MHATELVDLAALIALNSRLLVQENERVIDGALQDYWTASRCRLNRWGRGLRAKQSAKPSDPGTPATTWALVEEILVSEVLARQVAALFVAHDRAHDREESSPVGRNVLYGHIDARRRAMQLLLPATEQNPWSAADLQSLFSQCGRWNDLLLGHQLVHSPVVEFAFDADRAQEFSFDVDQFAVDPVTDEMTATFLRSSLRMALVRSDESNNNSQPFSEESNEQIAGAIIGCFGPGLFDSFGLLKSTWQQRMESVADDTLSMIDQFIKDESLPSRWDV